MADYLTTDTELTSVANAIRTKGGTSLPLVYPAGFVSAIEGISTGTDVSDTTATAGDVLSGKYFYTAAGVKTQGSITSKAAQTYTPTTTDQTIAVNQFLSGAQTIQGDANLVAGNIKKNIAIFGVTGSYEGSSVIVEPLSVTQNGTYSATSGKAYSPVTVNVSGSRGIKYAKFEMTASDTFTFVEGYPLTYSELMDDCFFCGAALGTNHGPAYISGINGYGSLMFAFDHEQFCLPISILNYNNGIITIDNAGYTFEQGFLYAFIPDFDFDANIATMSEFKSYLGIT